MTVQNNTAVRDGRENRCGCSCGQGQDIAGPSDTRVPVIMPVSAVVTGKDTRDHILARLGQDRYGHRVSPGLYSLGSPDNHSPVIVTANYTLSFDAVRAALAGHDAYILVLDTKGINVWCAAGKGTFGTNELINRIHITGLANVVHHHRLILPQLGAPGVSSHAVNEATGFHIEYGPVRARDLPAFLKERVATPEMRLVTFDLKERAVLIPVELRSVVVPLIIGTIALWFIGGWIPAMALLASVLAGTVLFPLLLPILPTADFSTKGMILGFVIAFPFAISAFNASLTGYPVWVGIASILSILLVFPSITAYLALNFTGCTTFTSRTGVRKEIFSYIPGMTGAGLIGVTFALVVGITHIMGVW